MAKKFKYRLETLLKLRTYKVKTEKETLMSIVNLRRHKEETIEMQSDYIRSMNDKRNILRKHSDIVSVEDYQILINHKNFIKSEINKLQHEKEQLIEVEDLQRIKLSEAMKDEKILTKLKDRKNKSYLDEIEKEESKTLDEIAQYRHGKSYF